MWRVFEHFVSFILQTQRVKEEDVISSLMKDLCGSSTFVRDGINIHRNKGEKTLFDMWWDLGFYSPPNLIFHCGSCGGTDVGYLTRGRTTMDSLWDDNFDSFGSVNFGQPQINIPNEVILIIGMIFLTCHSEGDPSYVYVNFLQQCES